MFTAYALHHNFLGPQSKPFLMPNLPSNSLSLATSGIISAANSSDSACLNEAAKNGAPLLAINISENKELTNNLAAGEKDEVEKKYKYKVELKTEK